MMRWQQVSLSPQLAGRLRDGGAYVITEGLAFTFLSELLLTRGTWHGSGQSEDTEVRTNLLQEGLIPLVKLDSEVRLGLSLPTTWILHLGNHQFPLSVLLLLLLVSPESSHDPGVFSFLEKHLDKGAHFMVTKCSQCRDGCGL